MKPLLVTLFMVVCLKSFGQNQYYFSNNGNDNNAGTPAAPFKSLDKLKKLSLHPGDIIRFRCGDVFYGSININTSGTEGNPIIFESFGSGRKPVINCAISISNWKKIPGKNIWQASYPAGTVINNLYINSVATTLSRYPKAYATNKGFLTIASHSGNTQLTGKENINGDMTSAELVYMPNQWLIERCKILSQNANTFTISRPDARDIADGWGYFIQNYFGGLSDDGEWCYDSTKNIISLYSITNPNNKNIEITSVSKGVSISNCSNIVLQNIEIDKSANSAIAGYNISNITLNNLKIDNSGDNGIKIQGKGNNILIENNYIDHTNNDAIYVYGIDDVKILKNILKNTGINMGRGESGTGGYTAIDVTTANSTNCAIQGNRIDSAGYIGINFKGDNISVLNNFVSNFCLLKSDGGGIYTWNGDQKNNTNQNIKDNIIVGASVGNVPVINIKPHIDGIYADDCTTNLTIENNTITNCVNSGIYLHGGTGIKVIKNTCYDNGIQFSFNISPNCDNVKNIIQKNIFFSKNVSQPVAIYGKQRNPGDDYGTFDNNVYSSPDPSQSLISGANEESKYSHRISLLQWKAQFAKDATSRSIGGTQVYGRGIKFIYNASTQVKTIPLQGSFKDTENNNYNGQISLQPYTSAILLKAN